MSSDRPNVLLIMTDQQPVSTIGCYGNSVVKTPAQDRLAREGMRFDNFLYCGVCVYTVSGDVFDRALFAQPRGGD